MDPGTVIMLQIYITNVKWINWSFDRLSMLIKSATNIALLSGNID